MMITQHTAEVFGLAAPAHSAPRLAASVTAGVRHGSLG
ncbi:hypothetical protein SAMN04489809_0196 [Microbacterium paraoxydans]|jgi:hypothetical protein|uniref:Uncharacterized protein n=1 Tax=Microbacterium paraoxydans TaxID=199592 RepID=A0A1H1LLH5_9MICO|nr:hypothetical protein SAMN04489809_0196 [Microbacterium paraoxydans]